MLSGSSSDMPFGWRGQIEPAVVQIDPIEDSLADTIKITIKDHVLEVGYQNEEDSERAIQLAKQFINAWIFDHDSKITVDLNQSWQVREDGGKAFAVYGTATLIAGGSITISGQVVDSDGNVVKQQNQNIILMRKAASDNVLSKALKYYTEEVVDQDRPLYGVYKAIEELTSHLGELHKTNGKECLAKLVGQNRSFVSDLMETTQLQRHARTTARSRLTEQECRSRAKTLIQGYANSLPG
jgi:hypothetical protein